MIKPFKLLFSFFLLLLSVGLAAQSTPGGDWRPEADPSSIVVAGNARFTVLADRLVRMEWSEDGLFEDRATLTVVNRKTDVPQFSVKRNGNGVTIRTAALTLTYGGDDPDGFTAGNLCVRFKMNGRTVTWHPGDAATGNLKGTLRTLDKIKGRAGKTSLLQYDRKNGESAVELEDGILSRDGWAIVDDSRNLVLEKNDSDWGEWVATRPEGRRQDLYVFAYGHNYKEALKAYTDIAGQIPLPPKYAFGYWWSRYWAYTDDELLQIASEMREREIPMDVFIIDMDWHETWKGLDKRYGSKDEFGQRHGWTGYTWNGDLFPNPAGFLDSLHTMRYKTALNLHPASGIQPYEEPYARFVDKYLSLTEDYDGPRNFKYGNEPYKFKGNSDSYAKKGYSAPVPFRLDQQAWAEAYFETVIRPLEQLGVDFWWLDWQQWKESKYVSGLSNTYWCNWAFWNDKLRRSRDSGADAPRPLIYHRWGGMGSHRYQVGFSGDTYDEWSTLKMLPYFTATASNVCYCYWGHDIGGHMQITSHNTDPELYTRWLQFAVFTPIFKTHSTCSTSPDGGVGLERKIWAYPSHYKYMKEAIDLRYALSPYIYTNARLAHESGIGLCRPMYYDYPETERAYEFDEQYLFGDDILAVALGSPAEDGYTQCTVWFPQGTDWYDMAAHAMRKAGTVQTLKYTIAQNPWFVKAGSIIPMAPSGIQNLQEDCGELDLLIVPGGNGSAVIYDDDGISQRYAQDSAGTALVKVSHKRSGKISTVRISNLPAVSGECAARRFNVMFEGVDALPRNMTLDGRILDSGAAAVADGRLRISLPEITKGGEMLLEIKF